MFPLARTVLLVTLLVQQARTDYKMMVTYGRPDEYSAYTTLGLSWEDCVTRCHAQADCLVVYDADCQMFTVGQIGSVLKEHGPQVAIKITSSDSCPLDDEVSDRGYIADNSAEPPTYRNWSMAYTGSSWSFADSGLVSCPINFTLLLRPKGPWCALVVTKTSCVTQTEAVTDCAATYGGVLSGIEDRAEFDFFAAKGVEIWEKRASDTFSKYGFWVNGERKTSCKRASSAANSFDASCNGTNEFAFSDPTLSSDPAGYVWSSVGNQPDGKNWYVTVANCVNIVIFNATFFGTDDFDCNNSTTTANGSNLCYKGYVCGRPPA